MYIECLVSYIYFSKKHAKIQVEDLVDSESIKSLEVFKSKLKSNISQKELDQLMKLAEDNQMVILNGFLWRTKEEQDNFWKILT